MKNSVEIDGKTFISCKRGSEITKYTKDYIGQLCRAEKISARMVGRSWFVEESSLVEFKKNADKHFGHRDAPPEKIEKTEISPETASSLVPPLKWEVTYQPDERSLLPVLTKKKTEQKIDPAILKTAEISLPSKAISAGLNPYRHAAAVLIIFGMLIGFASMESPSKTAALLSKSGAPLMQGMDMLGSILKSSALRAVSPDINQVAGAIDSVSSSIDGWWSGARRGVITAIRNFLEIKDETTIVYAPSPSASPAPVPAAASNALTTRVVTEKQTTYLNSVDSSIYSRLTNLESLFSQNAVHNADQTNVVYDSFGRNISNVTNSITTNGIFTNPTITNGSLSSISISGATITGSTGVFTSLGVATATPAAAFAVEGNGFINGNLNLTGNLIMNGVTSAGANLFSGAVIASSTLEVVGLTTLSYASTTQLSVSNTAYFPGSGIWNSFGNVGIGTTSPLGNLTIHQRNNGDTMFLAVRNTDTAPSGDFINYKDAAGSSLFRVDNSGNVYQGGIISSGSLTVSSVSTPQLRIQNDSTTGELTFSTTATGSTTISANGLNPAIVFTPQSNSLNAFSFTNAASSPILSVDTLNRRVGIGTTNPNYELEVNGSASTTNLYLPNTTNSGTGIIYKGTTPFIHNYSVPATDGENLFIGNTGNFTMAKGSNVYEASRNVGVGYNSLTSLTTGYFNVAIGWESLRDTTSGAGNISIGGHANPTNTTGFDNIAIGDDALWHNVSSSVNTAVGHLAGETLLSYTTPDITNGGNTFLGWNADVAASASTTLLNSSALGANSIVTKSNQVVIGSTAVTETLLNGYVGIGTTTPSARLSVENTGVNGLMASFYQPALATGNYDYIKLGKSTQSNESAVLTYIYNSTAASQYMGFGFSGVADAFGYLGNGNVGIGTTSPTFPLTVQGNSDNNANGPLMINGTGGGSQVGVGLTLNSEAMAGGRKWSLFASGPSATPGAGKFSIFDSSAGAYRMVIDDVGRFGFGTTTTNSGNNFLTIEKTQNAESVNSFYNYSTGAAAEAYWQAVAGAGNTVDFGTTGTGAADQYAYSWVQSNIPFVIGTNNLERLRVSAAGNVGIGTTTPWATFAVNPVAGAASNQFVIGSSTATNLIVTNSGNIGIGTANPDYLLTIRKDQAGSTGLDIINTSADESAESIITLTDGVLNSSGILRYRSTGSLGVMQPKQFIVGSGAAATNGLLLLAGGAGQPIVFATGGISAANESMRINSSGNVGIGTTSPQMKLDVQYVDETRAMRSYNTGGGAGKFTIQSNVDFNYLTYASPVGNFYQGVYGDNKLRLGSDLTNPAITINSGVSANVGIGTTDPGIYKLNVNGFITTPSGLDVRPTNAPSDDAIMSMNVATGYGRIYVIRSNGGSLVDRPLVLQEYGGNVGIGTSSPAQNLSVQGNGFFSGNILAANITATGTLTVASMSSSGAISAPYFTATSNTSTSTFAGGIQITPLTSNSPFLQLGANTTVIPSDTGEWITGGKSLRFASNDGDANYGSYLKPNYTGASNRSILTMGVRNAGVDTDILSLINGKAAIGTTTPDGILSVAIGAVAGTALTVHAGDQTPSLANFYNDKYSMVNPALQFLAYDTGTTTIGVTGASELRFFTNGFANTRMTISPTGNIGIGMTSPGTALEVSNNSATLNQLTLRNTNTSPTNIGITLFGDSASNAAARNWAMMANSVVFGDFSIRQSNALGGNPISAGTDRLYINQNGNVGIGTTTPSKTLTAYSTDEFPAFFSGGAIAGNYRYTGITIGQNLASGYASNIGFMTHQSDTSLSGTYITNFGETEGTTGIFVKRGGNVGIGTSTPQRELSISGAADNYVSIDGTDNNAGIFLTKNGGRQWIFDNSGTTDNHLRIYSNTIGEVMSILQNGKVGIGSSTPTELLTLSGADPSIRLFNTNIGGQGWNIFADQGDGTNGLSIKNVSLGTYALSIDGTNNVGIGVTAPLARLDVNDGGPGTGVIAYFGTSNVTNAKNLYLSRGTGTSSTDPMNIQGTKVGSGPENISLQAGGGNVGIGTTSPATALSVVGLTGAVGNFQVNSAVGINEVLKLTDNANYAAGRGVKMGFYVPTGTSLNKLGAEISAATESTTGTYLTFNTENASAVAERMRITSAGNVGIGTTTPSVARLHSYNTGGAYAGMFQGSTPGAVGIGSYLSSPFIQGLTNDTALVAANLNINPLGGNVGIGTTTLTAARLTSSAPAAGGKSMEAVDFNGVNSIYLLPAAGGTKNLISSNYLQGSAYLPLTLSGRENTTDFVLNNDGNIGVGMTPVASNGTFQITGSEKIFGTANADYMVFDHAGANTWRTRVTTDNTSSIVIGNDTGGVFNTKVLTLAQGGNVGIGTTNPSQKLEVQNGDAYVTNSYPGTGVTPATRRIFFDSQQNSNIHVAGAGMEAIFNRLSDSDYGSTLNFYTASDNTTVNRMTITNAGNVGIGTTTPTEKLNISGTGTAFALTDRNITNSSYDTLKIFAVAQNKFSLGVGPSTASLLNSNMTIDGSTGNIGIGTTTPAFKTVIQGNSDNNANGPLDIACTTTNNIGCGITMDGTGMTGGGQKWSFFTSGTGATPGAGAFAIYDSTAGQYAMTVLPTTRYVGIGTAAPGALLHVSKTYVAPAGGISANTGLIVSNDNIADGPVNISILARSSATSTINFGNQLLENAGQINYGGTGNPYLPDAMSFVTGGAERMRITNSGNVGIGTTTPGSLFSIGSTGVNAVANFRVGTSTIYNSLDVMGTLHATKSYVGDLIFANNFRFIEAPDAAVPQSLFLQNQKGDSILNIDENGNLNILGDICSNSTNCFNKALSTLSANVNALASTTEEERVITTAGLSTKIDDIASTTLALDGRLLRLERSSLDIASSTAALESSQPFIQSIATAVLDLIKSIGNLAVNTVTAMSGMFTNVQSDTIQSNSSKTNTLCVGNTCVNEDQLKALLSKANIAASTPTPTPTPIIVPVITPVATSTPSPTPISSPTPTPTPVSTSTPITPAPTPTPVPSLTPETSPAPTVSPETSPTPTPTPTPVPTIEPTPAPTPTPVIDLAPAPSSAPEPPPATP